MERIRLTSPETGEELELYILEQTCISGVTYLLATEEDDVVYELVEDDVELNAIAKVFAEMLEDVDFA